MTGRVARALARRTRARLDRDRMRVHADEVGASGLFDEAWYRGQPAAADVGAANPIIHYLRDGDARGLSPHPLFDVAGYRRRLPELAATRMATLVHYLREGEASGQRPNPLFDPTWYAARHPKLEPGQGRLLAHYAREGTARGELPSPVFEPSWYAARVPGGLPPGTDPLRHYLTVGARAGIDPHPLFDGAWYLTRHPCVARAGLDPVEHWVEIGAAAGLSPHPLFDSAWYRSRYPEADGDPLRHWIEIGARLGLSPHPLFDAAWYRARHPDVARRGLDPLRHFLEVGVARALPTHPLFDPVWYGSRHPEQRDPAAGLVHCAERRGEAGAEPSPLFPTFARYFLCDPEFPWMAGLDNPLAAFLEGGEPRFGAPPRMAFATGSDPQASVVIPAWGQPFHTVACLRSLAAARGETTFEAILVDDASPDVDYSTLLGGVPGLRVLRNERNLGFVGSCNRGAAESRGRRLVFLNSDTVVLDGWLDALLASFDDFPGAGVVGSKLLYPSGRTGEAGAIVWRDGSCWNYGRRHTPDSPEVEYARDVDYVSGAALAVDRVLFDSLEGFDEAFAPGFYEDVDLAWRVRAAGHRVLFQPASEVIHFEGVSSGLDPGSGMKIAQVRNRTVFFDRWGETLRGHRESAPENLDIEKDRYCSGEALVIDTATPTPGRDSRSLRLLHLLRILRELGLRPTFLPANGDAPEPWRTTLRRKGIRVLTPPWISSPEAFLAESRECFDVCIVCRPSLGERLLPKVRARWPHARVLFDLADLRPPSAQATFRERSSTGRSFGNAAMEAARNAHATVTTVNPDDGTTNAEESGEPVLLPWIYDTRRSPAPREGRHGILFVPGLQPAPAVDALLWFTDEILPRVARTLGALRIHVPAWPPLRPLLARDPRLAPLSDEELEDNRLFDRFVLCVAPFRLGAGIAGRLQPAMAAGLPCVTTPRAAGRMAPTVREQLTMATSAEGLAREVLRVYEDVGAWERASREGIAAVESLFGFEAARERMRALLADAGGLRKKDSVA